MSLENIFKCKDSFNWGMRSICDASRIAIMLDNLVYGSCHLIIIQLDFHVINKYEATFREILLPSRQDKETDKPKYFYVYFTA